MELQRDQVARLAERLPLPQIHLPFLFSADIGPAELDTLTAAITVGVQGLPSFERT
jgi:hypothetical protein